MNKKSIDRALDIWCRPYYDFNCRKNVAVRSVVQGVSFQVAMKGMADIEAMIPRWEFALCARDHRHLTQARLITPRQRPQ